MVSSLGNCLGSWLRDSKEHSLIALAAYFDGSSSSTRWDKGSVTLAGIGAEDSIWLDFDGQWKTILKGDGRRPEAQYMHMKEAGNLSGEFSYRNGWNQQKVAALVIDLLRYMQTLDKTGLRQFVCTIDLDAHRKLKGEGYPVDEPFCIFNQCCAEAVLHWYAAVYPGLVHSAHYFFDKQEPFKDSFEIEWKRQTEQLVLAAARQENWKFIKSITAVDMKDRPPLQAADMLAWATTRQRAGVEKPFQHLAHLMKKIIPATWIEWNEKALREQYPRKAQC